MHKHIFDTSADYVKRISAYNPFTLHKKGTRTKAFFALGCVCFFWGTTWIASREGVQYIPALQLAGIRQLIAGLIYVSFFLYKKYPLPRGKDWIPILILSVLNFMLSNGLSTWGVKYISAGLGSIIGAIFPLWLVVIGLFTAKEKIPLQGIAGLIIGFAGVCLIFVKHLDDFLNPDFRKGILLSLIATWTWAFATLYTKKQAIHFNPYFSLGLQMVISGAVLTTLTYINGTAYPLPQISWQSWAAIAYLILFGSIIAFVCYLYSLQHLPVEQASVYAYVNPVVAVAFGALFLGEEITWYIIAGGLIALLGVYLVNQSFRTLPPPEQPENEGV
ncbi:MAG: EamA family transporter [Chitinophagaceae bacterium]|nr:EamA family transporter [Chitinophagaceae bacterium]